MVDRQNCISRMVIPMFGMILLLNGAGRLEAQQSKDVIVINTPTQPVPTVVQNTAAQPVPTTVQNTVATTVQNTVATSVQNTVTAVVQNTVAAVVQNTATQPVPTVVQNLPAAPLGPTSASQLVARMAFLTDSSACTSASLTGVKELSFPLSIPAGKVFILTDFTWNLDASGYQPGFPVAVGLAGVTDNSGITSDRIIAISGMPNTAAGGDIKTETIANGVVALRPSAGVTHLCLFPDTFGTQLQAFAYVHGYLAADQ